MKNIFNMILHNWDNIQFIEFLRTFLLSNNDFEVFKSIPFSKEFGTWVGSQVPIIESKIEFYKDIIRMIENLSKPSNFIQHKNHLDSIINGQKEYLEQVKRSEFGDPIFN